jgi:hypothetical protein
VFIICWSSNSISRVDKNITALLIVSQDDNKEHILEIMKLNDCVSLVFFYYFYFLIRIVGGGVHIECPRGTAAMYLPIVPVPGDCEDGEVGGMKCGGQGKSKYSEKTWPGAILSITNPTCQTRARTRAAAVGSQRLTA